MRARPRSARRGPVIAAAVAAVLTIGLAAGAAGWMLTLDPISEAELEETLVWAAERRAELERDSCARTTGSGVRELMDEHGALRACQDALQQSAVALHGCSFSGAGGPDPCWTWADHASPELPPFAPDERPYRSSFALPYREGEWPPALDAAAIACEPLDRLLPRAIGASAGCSPLDLGHTASGSEAWELTTLVAPIVVRAVRMAAEHRGRVAVELLLDGVRSMHDARRGDVRWHDVLLVAEAEERLWTALQTLLDLDLGLTDADLEALDARLVSLRSSEPSLAAALSTGLVMHVDENVRALVPGEPMSTRFEAIARRQIHDQLPGPMRGAALIEDLGALDALVNANPAGDRDDWRWLWIDEPTVLSRSVEAATVRRVLLERMRSDGTALRVLAARLRAARVLLALYRARDSRRCPSERDVARELLDTADLGGPLEVRAFPPADVVVHPPHSLAEDVRGPLFVLTCTARPVESAGHWVRR
jgi:hypothetical protein